MRNALVVALSLGCLTLGIGVGYAAKEKPPGMDTIRGKPAKEAGLAALTEAETLAGDGSWELLAVARVYYLSGDKARGQAIIDRVNGPKAKNNDWQRIGDIYAAASENAKAEEFYLKALAADPKDDTGRAEVGAWYIRQGKRDKGEELFAQAFAKHADDVWHYVRASEALLGVPPGR